MIADWMGMVGGVGRQGFNLEKELRMCKNRSPAGQEGEVLGTTNADRRPRAAASCLRV